MKVTFIIPYFREPSINECILSLSLLKKEKIETQFILVVNGHKEISKDLEDLKKVLQGLEIILYKDRSRSIARNHALKTKVPTDFFAFIDSDVVLEESWLIKTLEGFKQPEVMVSQTRVKTSSGESKRLDKLRVFLKDQELDRQVPTFNSAAVVVKSQFFIDLGGFDPFFKRAEDTEFFYRVLKSVAWVSFNSNSYSSSNWTKSSWNFLIKRPIAQGFFTGPLIKKHGLKNVKKTKYKNFNLYILIYFNMFKLGFCLSSWFKFIKPDNYKCEKKKRLMYLGKSFKLRCGISIITVDNQIVFYNYRENKNLKLNKTDTQIFLSNNISELKLSLFRMLYLKEIIEKSQEMH
jgi:hypothetical protein